jgi:nitroreductase
MLHAQLPYHPPDRRTHGLGGTVDALKAILTKRDSRSFTEQPVADDTLTRVLQAGRMAGSAKNTQPCRFVVLTDTVHTEELAACGSFSQWIPQAPVNVAIVVPKEGRDFDAGRTAQNMMVAATALGLASCPVTMHDQDCARKVLGLPDDHRVVIVLAIGHPQPGTNTGMGAQRVALDEMVHRERWSS